MPYVVLCTGLEHPAKMEEKLSQHDIASYSGVICASGEVVPPPVSREP